MPADIFASKSAPLIGISLPITRSLRYNGILVGVSEGFLFRGQVQTGLNSSQKTALMNGRADIRLGTILATVALASFHFGNNFNLRLAPTFATLIGCV